MKLTFLVSVICALCYGKKVDFKSSKVVELQGQDAVKSFTENSQVTAVYFYKRVLRNIMFFYIDYKEAAESLEAYGVSLGFCNCTEEENKNVLPCKIIGVENGIHIFRSGNEMMFLELHKLRNVHSMVASILQLVLLKDVPVLRNKTGVSVHLGSQAGKRDLVLAYLPALGTYDHRVFLEVAYIYKDKLQFSISTNREATNILEAQDRSIKDISTVWWVWTSDNSFTSVRYRGKFQHEDLTKFANTISKPKLFIVPNDGVDHPFSSFEVPVVKFFFNAASEDQVYQEARVLIRYYGGSVGIVLIDMDKEEVKSKYEVLDELPTFSFQQNAETEELFLPASVSTQNVLTFLAENMEKKPLTEAVEEGLEERVDSGEDPPYNLKDVSEQDDPIADAVYTTRTVDMPLDLVEQLTDKTFPKYVKDSATAAVIFYFPYDAVSMGNLRMFGEVADKLGEQTTLKIARVNCFDWTDVCQKEKIIIYPTLRVYKNGEFVWDYKGAQDTQAMFSTLKLLELSSPVYETDKEKLMKYLVGKGEDTLTGVTNISVVGLFKNKNKQEKEAFQELARNSRDRIMFVYSNITDTDDIAKKFSASVPTVILSKYDDQIQPYTKFDGKFTVKNLQDFVNNNKLPKLTVLTPLMFPEVRRRFSELLILFTDGSDSCLQSEETVREIVKDQQFSNVSFNLMLVPDHTSVGYRVLREYVSEPKIPHLSFVKFQKGEVFNFDTAAVDKKSLTKWLSSIFTGVIEPSTKLHEEQWKPRNRGFEYLKIIEWEKRNPEQAGFNSKGEPLVRVPDEATEDDDDDEDDDKSSEKDEQQRGQHPVFQGRTSHHARHNRNMGRGGKSDDEGDSNDIEKKLETAEQENQENESTEQTHESHDHSEL